MTKISPILVTIIASDFVFFVTNFGENFSDEFGAKLIITFSDQFGDKTGEKFSDHLQIVNSSSPNLTTVLVTNWVRNFVASNSVSTNFLTKLVLNLVAKFCIILLFHVTCGADYRERSRLLCLFPVLVKTFQDLFHYPVMVTLTDY